MVRYGALRMLRAGSVAPISCLMARSSVLQINRCCLTDEVLPHPVIPPAVLLRAGESVGRLAFGNYSMMTGVAAALAAPLIGLAGADGFGIHLYEQSSAGKTTTANVASSLYGNPDVLRLTRYGTALGLANEAAAHNDALMPLDEIGRGADPVEVYKSAYALFNGTGKLQGAKEGEP